MNGEHSNAPAPLATERRFSWILYDGRAELGDTDDASVLEAFSSRRDLKQNLYTWKGHDGVLFEYDVQNGNELVNERMIGHLREGKGALLAKCSRIEEPLRKAYSDPKGGPEFDAP